MSGKYEKEWSKNEIEKLSCCPICKSKNYKKAFSNLKDKVFFCAPGKWNLYKCNECITMFLDPRPNEKSIVKAYSKYFTHGVSLEYNSLPFLEKLRIIFANGYRNWRYGTKDKPESLLGILIGLIWQNGQRIIDSSMRHISKPKKGYRLLDIGCGSSDFLLRAKDMGWDVTGLDFDIKAVEAAQKKGIDVRHGSIEILNHAKEKFDFITMAHVIEHVHNPIETLKKCYNLLNKNGKIWIDTPNIEAQGLEIFGESWLGLDCPRHLVLFSNSSLFSVLKDCGFKNIKNQPYRPVCDNFFRQSMGISNSVDPFSSEIKKYNIKTKVKNSEKIAFKSISQREFITLTAQKT